MLIQDQNAYYLIALYYSTHSYRKSKRNLTRLIATSRLGLHTPLVRPSFSARVVVRVATKFSGTENLSNPNGGRRAFFVFWPQVAIFDAYGRKLEKSGRLTLVMKMQSYLYTHIPPPSWICDRAKLLV